MNPFIVIDNLFYLGLVIIVAVVSLCLWSELRSTPEKLDDPEALLGNDDV